MTLTLPSALARLTLCAIPEGKYTVVCCDGKISEQGLDTIEGGHVVVNGQSALILHD